jgi:hypothetical protein
MAPSVGKIIHRGQLVRANVAALWEGFQYARALPDPELEVASEPQTSPLERYFDDVRDGPGIWKWRHYFEIYDRHLSRFVGKEVHMVEIGVYSGGSLPMWRDYLGDQAQIHGVDIEPACRAYESDRISISIGDQADPAFWERFIAEHPRIDIVLDDGGHSPDQQIATLKALLPHIAPGGVYMCEDVQGRTQPFHSFIDGLSRPLQDIQGTGSRVPLNAHQQIASIHRYPILTVIEKPGHRLPAFEAHRHGSRWQPFYEYK